MNFNFISCKNNQSELEEFKSERKPLTNHRKLNISMASETTADNSWMSSAAPSQIDLTEGVRHYNEEPDMIENKNQ